MHAHCEERSEYRGRAALPAPHKAPKPARGISPVVAFRIHNEILSRRRKIDWAIRVFRTPRHRKELPATPKSATNQRG